MKKKTLLLGVAALGVLALASCGGEADQPYETPDLEGRTMNVYLNYKGQSGVSFTGKVKGHAQYTNPLEGNKTYTQGAILPMWEAVAKNLKCEIKDAVWAVDEYVSTDDQSQKLSLEGYDGFASLDLVVMNNSNSIEFAKNGRLANLYDYLDVMPNYKKFLDEHPVIKSEMTNADGKMFMLPYFDGLDSAEHLFILNTELVEAILDADSTANFDTATVTNGGVYQPVIDTSADFTVGISVNGKLEDLTVKKATNPVKAQNDLTTKTGKAYADALRTYIDTAYMTSGKYTKRSEVFNSESACYTTDDYIALMRAVVNNNAYLKGKFGYEGKVEGFIPRTGENSRIDSVLWLMQIFGVQGIRGMAEKDALYFDKDGKLCDGRTNPAAYDGLTKLHQLYQEGLIIEGFDAGNKTAYNSQYLTGKSGAALAMFDYNATQTVNNAVDANGIGTEGSKFKGVMPVLPPLTKWENDNVSKSNYKYTRYLESSRANKGSGTVIPLHSTEEGNKAACMLADYFFSEEGALLQDYGPENYRDGTVTLAGVQYPKYKAQVISETNKSTLGWNDYCRMAIGSTQGLGHVRTDAVEYQFTNEAGKVGAANVSAACESGAVIVAMSSRKPGFGASVPSQWSSSPENATSIQTLVDFWSRGVGAEKWRQVVLSGWENAEVSRSALEGFFAQSAEVYLKHYQTLLEIAGL